jgi:5-(carboxyamino)imidazole ribonucleotide mutase
MNTCLLRGAAMSQASEVLILMGSKSDWETIKPAAETLREFGISCRARVLSAHRTPTETAQAVRDADAAGTRVFIAAAGMAAHLAGAVAAHTTRPVLGVPLASSDLNGLDALLSTVQMPPGVPVATFAIGQAGAVNAALFAVAILANERPALRAALEERRQKDAEKVLSERLE